MMAKQARRQPEHLKKIHLLIVDNDQRIIEIIGSVLKYLGFSNVYGARDGFQAVERMRDHKIDMIITDWELQQLEEDFRLNLPDNPVIRSDIWLPVAPKDGACFVKYIRASKYSPNPYIPVIMMTGIGLRDGVEYARDAGVNEIVIKPISIENLCNRIIKIIESPRPFITSQQYKGPCRRSQTSPDYTPDRRKHDIKLFKHAS